MIGICCDEAFAGGHHRGDAALHIRGAACVEHAVADFRFERGRLPQVQGAGGHYVGMTGKGEQRVVHAASRPEVVHLAER